MNEFRNKRRALAETRLRRDEAETRLRAVLDDQRRLRRLLESGSLPGGRLRRTGTDEAPGVTPAPGVEQPSTHEGGLDDLKDRLDKLKEEEKTRRDELDNIKDELKGRGDELQTIAPPQQLVEQLEDDFPFLLLPVRLETRFMAAKNGGRELRIRIFPDDIAVQTHETALTHDETLAGQTFWEETWRAGSEADSEKAAWRSLSNAFGSPRAAWIARTLTPSNADAANPELEPAPEFPGVQQKAETWSRPPTTRVMPDRFVVITFSGDARTHEVVGNAIPDPLFLGPDPQDESGGFDADGETVTVGDDLAWMTDFDRAEALGMGIRIPLTDTEAGAGFDRVLALGLRLSDDEQEARARLESLFDAHHYTGGLAFVPQGTATNNTSEDTSGYTSADPDAELSFEVERGNPLFNGSSEYTDRTDGQRLSDAVGVRPEVLHHIRNAGAEDGREAAAMHRALWPATLGYFMEEMMSPVFDEDTIDSTRTFLVEHVSGRGALPALRTGVQPYGVLTATAFSRFRPDADAFLLKLQEVLGSLDETWSQLAGEVARVGSDDDPARTLLQILGLHATSVEFHQRRSVGPDYPWNLNVFAGRAGAAETWSSIVNTAAAELLRELDFDFEEIPEILNLAFFQNHSLLDGPIVDDAPISETEPVAELANSGNNYIEWLQGAGMTDLLMENLPEGAERPRALLYLALRQARMLCAFGAAARLHRGAGTTLAGSVRERELVHVREQPESDRRDLLAAMIPNVSGEKSVSDFLASPDSAERAEAAEWVEQREAMTLLAGLPTARLERLFAEHLDICSYRLDAWRLGMVSERLASLREKSPEGVYLGAFAWLEDLRPSAPQTPVSAEDVPESLQDGSEALTYDSENAGIMHAPSLNHAAAGAILRSAALAGKVDADVDISSQRVRTALGYLEGVRNGQSLSELLGYTFERGLHDRHSALELDQYIYPLRETFSLAPDLAGDASTRQRRKTLDANVVDGLKLVRTARIEAYPWGASDMPETGTAEAGAIVAEVSRIQGHLDALGDIGIAESVYQSVLGNFERAGAMLDAISQGGRPPEPDVVRTPRSGAVLTHRVSIHFDADSPAQNPWASVDMTPRAFAEPRLNNWLGGCLHDPEAVCCVVDIEDEDGGTRTIGLSLSELGIQPIDLVLLLGPGTQANATGLLPFAEYAIRAREGLSAGAVVTLRPEKRAASWAAATLSIFEILPLARALHRLITRGRALGAADLQLPSDESLDLGDRGGFNTEELRDRAETARAALAASRAALNAAVAAAESATGPFDLGDLRAALLELSRYGLTASVPANAAGEDVDARDVLVSQANSVITGVDGRLEDATTALGTADAAADADARTRSLAEVARALFGRDFPVLPVFTPRDPVQFDAAVSAGPGLLAAEPPLVIDSWVEGVQYVRPAMSAFAHARLLAETLHEDFAIDLEIAQIARTPLDRWLGVALPPTGEVTGDVLSLVLVRDTAPDAPRSGILVDEWVERIPALDETTGVVFHHDQPAAQAPQALILAIPPERTGNWRWDDLVDTLLDTLDLAKRRAVTTDQLGQTALAQLLPATMTAVATRPVTFSTDFLANVMTLPTAGG